MTDCWKVYQLVAEGFQMHLDRYRTEDRSFLDEQFQETRAFIQLTYGQIQERVERRGWSNMFEPSNNISA